MRRAALRIFILSLLCAGALHLSADAALQIFPNPYSATSSNKTVTFAGATKGSRIEIYDLEKKLVAELPVEADYLTWNITDNAARPLVAGIYMVVVRDTNGSEFRRVFLNNVGQSGSPLIDSSVAWGPAEYTVRTADANGHEDDSISVLLLRSPLAGFSVSGTPSTVPSLTPATQARLQRTQQKPFAHVTVKEDATQPTPIIAWGEGSSVFSLRQATAVGPTIEVRSLSSADSKNTITAVVSIATPPLTAEQQKQSAVLHAYQFDFSNLSWTVIPDTQVTIEAETAKATVSVPALVQWGWSKDFGPKSDGSKQ